MAFVGFQYEPVSLDVNEVCFKKNIINISNTHEKSRKSRNVTELYICGK